MDVLKSIWKGMTFVILLGLVAMLLQGINLLQNLHISSLIIAIILGIIIKNTVKLPVDWTPGIQFSFKKILRLAIILLGFRLSFDQVAEIGGKGLFLVAFVTTMTILFTVYFGKKLGLDRDLSLLIGAGSSICGASAIAAVAPVMNAKEKDMTFAIATVTIFGTISMFLYPVIYQVFHLQQLFYAVWVGASVHEVAQVVAAGFAAGNEAGQYATLVKLSRVLLIIPFVLVLGVIQTKSNTATDADKKAVIPWFVFGFLGVVMINSIGFIPQTISTGLVSFDNFLLTVAMAGMGLETSIEKMKKVGLKPFYLGFITTIFISVFSFLCAHFFF